MDWTFVLTFVVLFCLAAVSFAYVGYPVCIYLCSRLFGRTPTRTEVADDDLPFVSLLIAAHNEEESIGERLANALALDYPPDRFEIVIASDGSTDRTNAIVREVAGRFPGLVRLLDFPVNRGKAAVLKDSVPQLRGEVVVLSDANTCMRPDAVRKLAGWFATPEVGAVCGKLVLVDPTTGQNVDGLYWKYETFLKKCESRLGALLGSNGAIYAIRKSLFPVVPPGTVIDDFYIPLEAKRKSGCRIVFDTAAVASEETAPDTTAEFRRRVRIGAGGFQSIGLLWQLLSPAHGWVAVSFGLHKVLRWVGPFFLLAALLANVVALFLPHPPLVEYTMIAQGLFYALALVGWKLKARARVTRFVKLPNMFVMMNVALLLGFFRWLFRIQKGTWTRTPREPMAPAVVKPQPLVTPSGRWRAIDTATPPPVVVQTNPQGATA
jgi:cellulose synthase/poly-beta-1,6-N-acetylglucosamine synthase-like glycosyltransferase